MPAQIKFMVDTVDDHQIRHRAQRAGLSVSEFCRRAVKQAIIGAVAEMPTAIVDEVQRGSGNGKAVGLYLSGPLATAVAKLARESSRSRSWIARDLLRSELKRRGLLNKAAATADQAEVEVAAP